MESNWRTKIARAREHLASLTEEVSIFLAAAPYRVETSREGDDVVVRVHDLARIPPRLSLIVGDAAHNARSALDHLVVGLAERGQGTLGRPPTSDAEERRLYFPASNDLSGFRKWAATAERFFSPATLAAIEAVQGHRLLEQIEKDHGPLDEIERQAHRLLDPLARLHRLDNHDKHRRLALSLWFPGTVEQGAIESLRPGDADVLERVTDPKVLAMLDDALRRESEDPTFADFFFAGGPLIEGAEIGRYMRVDRGRVVDDEQVSATLRIVLIEAGITDRFHGAPPVQSAIRDLIETAENVCAFVESHMTT